MVLNPDSSRTITTTLEYEFPNQWLLATLEKHEQSGTSRLTRFNFSLIPESVEHAYRFTLFGKQPVYYVVLLLALAALAFSIYALIACIRTPMEKRK